MTQQAVIDTAFLARFCDPETSRYAIDKPWHETGWLNATDGRVCVRAPAEEGPNPGGRVPDVGAIFKQFPGEAEWVSVPCPDVDRPNGSDWPREHHDCDVCSGMGQFCCDSENCHYDHDCCECEGSGKVLRYEAIAFKSVELKKGLYVATRYLWLLANLPEIEMSLPSSSEKPVVFRFAGGGQALLMPLRGPA